MAFFFRMFFNKIFIGNFGRAPESFRYAAMSKISEHYFEKAKRALVDIPVFDNYFVAYILTGSYGIQNSIPPYLKQENFECLKQGVHKISLYTARLENFLTTISANSFSKFNLSDVFEAMSPEKTQAVFYEILRTGKNGAILAYWNNLVKRSSPESLRPYFEQDTESSAALYKKDRAFFYERFVVETLQK